MDLEREEKYYEIFVWPISGYGFSRRFLVNERKTDYGMDLETAKKIAGKKGKVFLTTLTRKEIK